MTTVIATNDALFTDTLCGYTVPFQASKSARIGDSIYGCAGDDLDDFILFLAWLRGDTPKPKLPKGNDFDVLEVSPDGIFLWSKKMTRVQVHESRYAVGSGGQYAIGAMEHGATPEQAIIIAAKFDPNTRPPIECVKLGRK